jgi:hypothetical protein
MRKIDLKIPWSQRAFTLMWKTNNKLNKLVKYLVHKIIVNAKGKTKSREG